MEYVINILEKEKYILQKCLNEWESKEYPLAKKERDNRLMEVNKVINILNSIINLPTEIEIEDIAKWIIKLNKK